MKTFEQYKQQYRTVDMSEFFFNYDNYLNDIHTELTKGENIFVNIPSEIEVIRNILIGNKIEFLESVLNITVQVIPSEINLNKQSNFSYFLSIYCEEDKNIRVLDLLKDVPNIVKIWGEETKIEKIIRIVKETEKYNL